VKVKITSSHYSRADDKGQRRYSAYTSLTSTLDSGEWSAPSSGRFLPGEGTSTRRVEGWVGPAAGLQKVDKKYLAPTGNRTPTVQPAA
jgi:hypothetical protein